MAEQAETPDPAEGVREAIAEAVATTNYDPATGKPLQEGTPEGGAATEGPQPAPPGESAPSTVDSGTGEAAVEGEKPQPSDIPDVYWGTDLRGLSDEQKQAVIARFEQNESYIRSLQEELAKNPERTAPAEPEPMPEVTDDDLLRAAGLNPDELDDGSRNFALPLLRNQLALEERLETQEQYVQQTQAETYWNRELDKLEAEFGPLPGERINVLEKAVKEKIASPHELYFRISAPARREVSDFVGELRQKAQREVGQRDAAGQTRPSTGSAASPGITKEMSLREAVKVAAQEAEKETKLSWTDAVKSRIARGASGPGA